MTTRYEWDIETMDIAVEVDGEHDILDHNHSENLRRFRVRDLRRALDPLDPSMRLVLVRDVWDDRDGLVDRSWAYVEDGRLPERFTYCPEEGRPVPKTFVRELRRTIEWLKPLQP
jgi:hypothetical protein